MNAFSHRRLVEFCETDAAGIAHFSSLTTYMEQAEHALFRSLGLSVFPQQTPSSSQDVVAPDDSQSGEIEAATVKQLPVPVDLDVTWPRVHISLDFLGPARFEDVITIDVVVAKLGETSVTFEHFMHGPQHPVARGKSISVCCRIDRSGLHQLSKQPIPKPIRDKLSTYLRD